MLETELFEAKVIYCKVNIIIASFATNIKLNRLIKIN